ncbi:MAG: 30S ribosomal protein S20 [Lentisphaerae bacterium]|nr:30S ribosomal protein S20 [Lentisphaerota bacterium]
MPNIKSAMKRVRQSNKARDANRAVRAAIGSARRKFFEAVEAKDKPTAVQLYRAYCSILDKSAKKGIVKRNMAIRRKHRASLKIAAMA